MALGIGKYKAEENKAAKYAAKEEEGKFLAAEAAEEGENQMMGHKK